jgi:hypothetical protein
MIFMVCLARPTTAVTLEHVFQITLEKKSGNPASKGWSRAGGRATPRFPFPSSGPGLNWACRPAFRPVTGPVKSGVKGFGLGRGLLDQDSL